MTTTTTQESSSFFEKYLNGIGGWNHGSLFCINDKIDTKEKAPGMTSLDILNPPQTPWQIFVSLVTLKSFVYSPNLTWFVMALCVWAIAPYDMEAPLWTSLQQRLAVNHIMVFGYAGFWHVTLYVLNWAQRPFAPKPQNYQISARLIHNLFYTWLGVLQWTITEIVFIYLYQTGRLDYDDNSIFDVTNTKTLLTTFIASMLVPPFLFIYLYQTGRLDYDDNSIFDVTNTKTLLTTFIASMLVPPFRDVHFYFSHRLIHIKFLYKYIHSVHHRNTDIEPFSGLAMHPYEHLYYYSCYAPCLLLKLSPFILFWMEFHTLIAPFASHSGWEDHFQADLHHYLHHRYYECNYGAGIPFDVWFGTYRDKLKPQHSTTALKEPIRDPKATLLKLDQEDEDSTPPIPLGRLSAPENIGYLTACTGASLLILALTLPSDTITAFSDLAPLSQILNEWKVNPHVGALLLSTVPCWMALIFCFVGHSQQRQQQSLLWPFDKDSFPKQLLHIGLGMLLGMLPVTYYLDLIMAPPLETA